MDSGRKEVQEATQKLISAQHKIGDLEIEVSQLRERLILNNEGMDEVKETLEQALEVAHLLAGRQASEIEALKSYNEVQRKVLDELITLFPSSHFELGINSLPQKVSDTLRLAKQRVEFSDKLCKAERDRDMYKESHANHRKAFGALQDAILGKDSVTETYDDLLAPVTDLVKFRSNTLYCLGLEQGCPTDYAVKVLKNKLAPGFGEIQRLRGLEVSLRKELKLAEDYKQYEVDVRLAEVRKVLGAKDRNDDRPHETALQAAKRVMEEKEELKTELTLTKVKYRNTVKDSAGRTYSPPAGYVLIKATEFEETLERAVLNAAKKIFN